MRKFIFVAGLFLVLGFSAAAQDKKVELFAGYSYARVESVAGDRSNLNGWNGAIQANLGKWFGLVGDFSGQYGKRTVAPGVEKNINTHAALFGPSIQFPARVRPFAHALFGVARGSAGVFGSTQSDSAFGMALGGGIDADLSDHVAWRIIQGDYLMNRFFSRNNNNVRLASGLVIRF